MQFDMFLTTSSSGISVLKSALYSCSTQPTTHLSRVSYRDVWIGRGCQSNHWIAIFSSAFGRHVVLLLWHLLKRLLRLPILLSVTTTTCLPIGLQLSIFIETKRDMREEWRRIRTAKTNSFEDFRHQSTANGWKMKRHFFAPKNDC